MKKKGSAIVIAVFLVAAIGGIAFSFGRIFLLDASSASLSENGSSAYYAAESGIEEGFLRYRYNKGAEVPLKTWKIGDKSVFRANLGTNVVSTGGLWTMFKGIQKSTPISDNANQIYDLRMGFIGTNGLPFYGQDANSSGTDNGRLTDNDFTSTSPLYGSNDYSFLKIAKDESYKINLESLGINSTNLNTRDISLFANFVQSAANIPAIVPTRTNSAMYIKVVVDYNGDGSDVQEYKTIITSDATSATCTLLGANCTSDVLVAEPKTITPNPGVAWRYNKVFSNLFTKIGAPFMTSQSKVTLSLRPLYNDAYIGLSSQFCLTNSCDGADKTAVVPGPFTNITSVGYYGGVTRTIEANIDRQSGTLYDLFDYVIFAK